MSDEVLERENRFFGKLLLSFSSLRIEHKVPAGLHLSQF